MDFWTVPSVTVSIFNILLSGAETLSERRILETGHRWRGVSGDGEGQRTGSICGGCNRPREVAGSNNASRRLRSSCAPARLAAEQAEIFLAALLLSSLSLPHDA